MPFATGDRRWFADIDYGMLVEVYGASKDGKRHDERIGARKARIFGNPDPRRISSHMSNTAYSHRTHSKG